MKACLLIVFVLLSGNAAALSCAYPDNIQGQMVAGENCGELDANGYLLVADKLLEKIDFQENQPACLLVEKQSTYSAYYINRQGQTRATLFFDNGCDYFKGGVARTIVNGKAAFFDKSLKLTVVTDFDVSQPFYYDHAVVCNGPFVEEQVGEHTMRRGGQCGLIDRAGKLVVLANYSLEEQDIFTRYINAHNECEPPPITTADDALCHAKRHTRYLEYHSDDWSEYTIRQGENVWYIDFTQSQEPETRLTLELDSQSAHWISIIPQKANN